MSENVVYIVQAVEGGPVKIGTTRRDRLKQRLSELQTGNPSQLRYVRLFRGGKELEARLHSLYEFQRISPRSEWFIVDKSLQELIDEGLTFADDACTVPLSSVYKDVSWDCDRCGLKVTSAGFLGVSEHDAHEYERATAARRSGSKWRPMPLGEIVRGPSPAAWVCLHDECMEPGESYSYWIAVDRVSSFPQIIDFTAHISGRVVQTGTDWFSFLRRKLNDAWVTA